MAGPLGALPRLSLSARRALVIGGLLSAIDAIAIVAIAWSLSTTLTSVVQGQQRLSTLWLCAGGLVVRSTAAWLIQVVATRAAARTKEELRAQVIDHALGLGPEWVQRSGAVEVSTIACSGLDALDAYFTKYLPALVSSCVVPTVVGVAIGALDWQSAALIVLTIPLIPIFAVIIGKYTQDRVANATTATTRLAGHMAELLRALPMLTVFGRAAAQAKLVAQISGNHRRRTMATLRITFISSFALELISTLSVALVAVDIGIRLVSGHIGLAAGLAVLIMAPECYQPLRNAGAAFHASEDGLEAVTRVAKVLDEPVRADSAGVTVKFADELRVDGLSVRRGTEMRPDNSSFSVRPGEIHRLDAPSGFGKSTTIAAILGFVGADFGRITVDGVDLADVAPKSWLAQVAWVPQQPQFTKDTVLDELRSAVFGRAVTDEPLHEAARSACAEHLMSRNPAELSIGEQQRVAVAKAFARVASGARLLLLDEPTAHLDHETAATITASIERVAASGVAVVLAAHQVVAARENTTDFAREAPVAVDTHMPDSRVRIGELVDWRTIGAALLGAIALAAGVALTATAGWLIARASQQPPILTLSVAFVVVRTFGLTRGVLRYAERLVSHEAAFRLAGRLRVKLWNALVAGGPTWTADLRRTDGVQRLVNDVDTVRDGTPRVIIPPMQAVIVCVAAIVAQAVVLPSAGVALLVGVLVAAVLAPTITLLVQRRATVKLAAGRREVHRATTQLLTASAELRAVGEDARYQAYIARLDDAHVRLAQRQAFGAGIGLAVRVVGLGGASVMSVVLGAHAALNPIMVPLLALLPLALAETTDLIPNAAQLWPQVRDALRRIQSVYRAAENVTPYKNSGVEGESGVRLTGVTAAALTDFSARVEPGTFACVVGPSGIGKSTFMSVLLGFVPIVSGEVVVGKTVAVALQEPMLVSTTVRENLRMGNPHADDEQLRLALKTACLGEYVDRLDDRIGTGGSQLSGGQASRLAVARMLLAAPEADLVLLDEPTAHLDAETATQLVANVLEFLTGKTVIMVTHDPAEAARADQVISIQ